MTVAVAEFLVFVVLPVALVAIAGTVFVALGGDFEELPRSEYRGDSPDLP
jgi:hypothetical protein